jgi:hypothetical protein
MINLGSYMIDPYPRMRGTMQTPSVGRIVHVRVDPATNNGSDVAPGIITRVWSDTLVNVRIFPDSGPETYVKTSMTLAPSREAATELAENRHVCWWPPYVPTGVAAAMSSAVTLGRSTDLVAPPEHPGSGN